MTRDKAMAAVWAITNLDGFDELAAEIRERVADWKDTFQVDPEFEKKLNELLDEEFHRLEKVLEDL